MRHMIQKNVAGMPKANQLLRKIYVHLSERVKGKAFVGIDNQHSSTLR